MNPDSKATVIFVIVVLSMLVAPAYAQQRPAEARLDAELFPPDQVMRFQGEIGLTREQARSILEVVQETQRQMIEVQWALQPELEAMRRQLAKPRVDEEEVRARLGVITATEARAKELQLLLMVRVKNLLTPDQQSQLKRLRGDP